MQCPRRVMHSDKGAPALNRMIENTICQTNTSQQQPHNRDREELRTRPVAMNATKKRAAPKTMRQPPTTVRLGRPMSRPSSMPTPMKTSFILPCRHGGAR